MIRRWILLPAIAGLFLAGLPARAQRAEELKAWSDASLNDAYRQLSEKRSSWLPAPASADAVEGYYLRQASAGIRELNSKYCGLTGFYGFPSFKPGWWVSGNIVAALADYTKLSGDRSFVDVIDHTYSQAPMFQFFFRNNFYDDEGWWALAWIAAYDATGKEDYLFMAESIFDDMAGGWDKTCGGGIWWSKDRKYKNAIPNELFLSAAAGLAARADGADLRAWYLRWAKAEWSWFRRSGMINGDGLINDGLDASCRNNGQTTWTYNQGVILGGLAELDKAAPELGLRSTADSIASAAISKLADGHGILHEPCEPDCSDDGGMFKGAFVRNLLALDAAFPNPRYKAFIMANAASMLDRDQGPGHSFGPTWSGPYTAWSPSTQASALDLLIAAAAMSR